MPHRRESRRPLRSCDTHPQADDEVLGNAHKIFLKYCSSDAYWGDAAAFDDGSGGTYEFRGQRIVQAPYTTNVARRKRRP